MRVSCGTIDEFLACLREDGPKGVWQNTVRYTRDENKKEGVPRIDINLRVSAVMIEGDGSYLLEAGEDCGEDLLDGVPELIGSERATILFVELGDLCTDLNLRLMPGLIHE